MDLIGRKCILLLWATLCLKTIAVASLSTGTVTHHVTPPSKRTIDMLKSYGVTNSGTNTTGGKPSDKDDNEDLAFRPMYTRLIPAVSTVVIFLIGLLVICINYCLKQKENSKEEENPIQNEQTNSDWLAELKKTQKKGSLGFIFSRRGSSFQAKILSRDKKIKMKKYALYDDMLAKYRRSLKMQKLQSMRKANTTMSQSSDSYDESQPHLKRISSRMRMKELAMRHRISQEHQHNDFHLELPSRQRHLPRWGTTTSSQSQDDNDAFRLRSATDTDIEVFREELDRSMEQSPNASFQISIDDDIEPLLAMRSRVPPSSPSLQDTRGQQKSGDTINLLDEPDIVDALRKLSSTNEQPNRSSKRPKSMLAILSGVNIGTLDDKTENKNRATEKRRSWYQGIFKPSPKKPLKNTASVDDLIETHMKKALFSRFSGDILDDVDVDTTGITEEESYRNQHLRKRPKSWVQPSEIQRQKGAQTSKKDSITELFANLMDLPPADARPRSNYDNVPNPLSLQQVPKEAQIVGIDKTDDVAKLTEKEELMLLNEVERRMIANIHDNEIMEDNEVTALETLLNDVSRFCREYSEDYENIESRKQMSFSEANETLSRSTTPNSRFGASSRHGKDSFDGRKAKVMSVYDTHLLESKPDPNLSTTL